MIKGVQDPCFAGSHERCTWTGQVLTADDIDALRDSLRERALDLARAAAVTDLLRDLAATGMAEAFVTSFLAEAQDTSLKHWQVGEALAEALLEDHHAVEFPWNTRRDERTTKASLPGADLVGISGADDTAMLVFGEVKSSSDADSPPQVLYGKDGMVQQLERLISDRKVQLKLIRWLEARVSADASPAFEAALGRFVNSQGSAIRLVGCLMRDTEPKESDVVARGRNLGDLVHDPGTADLFVWYLPYSMADWPSLVAA